MSEEPMSKDAELLGYCEKMINGFPTEWEGAVLVAHAFKALKQENERANAKIARYQALVREIHDASRREYIEYRIAEIEST